MRTHAGAIVRRRPRRFGGLRSPFRGQAGEGAFAAAVSAFAVGRRRGVVVARVRGRRSDRQGRDSAGARDAAPGEGGGQARR